MPNPPAPVPISAVQGLTEALKTRVTLTQLKAAMKNKVSSATLQNALRSIDAANISDLTNQLNAKADSTDLDALAAVVAGKADVGDLETLTSDISSKVDTDSFTALVTLVNAKALGTDLTALAAQVATLSENVSGVQEDVNAINAGAFAIYNIKHFGAVGDGTTDDTAAILAATQAAWPTHPYNEQSGAHWGTFESYAMSEKRPISQGGTVYYPPGVYRTTQPIPLDGMVRHVGAGRATVIKANLPSNTTSGAFYTRADTIGQTQHITITDMTIWTEYGHGIDMSQGMLNGTMRNLLVSAAKYDFWVPTSGYIQACIFEDVICAQIGEGALHIVGNLNHYHRVSVGAAGYRAGVVPADIDSLVNIKGGGHFFKGFHVETGSGVVAFKIGGAGPSYLGYQTGDIQFDGLWYENQGHPVTGIGWVLDSVSNMRVAAAVYSSDAKVSVKDSYAVYFNYAGEILTDAADLFSYVTVGEHYDNFGIDGDRSETRGPVVDHMVGYAGHELEAVPIARFGNLLYPNPTMYQYGSDATVTYECVTDIGWCWKLHWTSEPGGGYFDIVWPIMAPPSVADARTNLYCSAILDYSEATDAQIQFWYGPGTNSSPTIVRWRTKGPVQCKWVVPDQINTNGLFMRVYTQGVSSLSMYLKDLTVSVGGRFVAPPAPEMIKRWAAGPSEHWGTAAPTDGYWVRGSVCHNSTPATGQPVSWHCTVSGSPGTWRPSANLA